MGRITREWSINGHRRANSAMAMMPRSGSSTRHSAGLDASTPIQSPIQSAQIPIDERGTRGAQSFRGFLPWRLPDAGPSASGCVCDGRHPKPLYGAMLVKPPCLTKLATISSFAAATLFGRPWAHRQALLVVELSCPGRSRRQVRGELAIGRGDRATTLYSVDPRGSEP